MRGLLRNIFGGKGCTMYKVPSTRYEIRGTKYGIKVMSNAERRVQNDEVVQSTKYEKDF
jgi:hypothetical protein